MSEDERHVDQGAEYGRGYRARPPLYVLGGLAAGLIGGLVIAALLGGNPFSAANRVEYRDITVGSIQEDQICWAQDPTRRDALQTCAILALDPSLPPPAVGDVLTIGVVELRSPDGEELRQVVWVEAAAAAQPDTDATATPGLGTSPPEQTPTP